MKIPKHIRKFGDYASKYANLHRINRQAFEIWLEENNIDLDKLCNDGGDEFGYLDIIGYGYSNVNWQSNDDHHEKT